MCKCGNEELTNVLKNVSAVLCYIRGPEGLLIGLAEQLSKIEIFYKTLQNDGSKP